MQLELLVNAFWSVVGLLAFVAFYFAIFEPMMADAFRERLAAVGDKLDTLIQEHSELDRARAVRRIRAVIDGYAASAENITLLRLVLAMVLKARHADPSAAPSFRDLLHEVRDPASRRALLELHLEVQIELVRHVCKNTPLGWLLVCVAAVAYSAQLGRTFLQDSDRVFRRILGRMAGPVNAMEQQAELAGACPAPA